MVKFFLFFIFLFNFFVSGLLAEEADPKEIVEKSEQLMRADSNFGVYQIDIITPSWQRTLKIEGWELGREKAFVHITYPARDRGNNFLKLGYNMWQYVANIERTIRIPPSMMRDSWMGSDFTNDDLVQESNMVTDYYHQLLSEEEIGSNIAYKIKLLPKPDAPVVWEKLILWIRKNDYVPLRREYYDGTGTLEKVLTFHDIQEMDGRDIPVTWKMEPKYKEGHKTFFRILEIKFNLDIDERVFTLQNLRRHR